MKMLPFQLNATVPRNKKIHITSFTIQRRCNTLARRWQAHAAPEWSGGRNESEVDKWKSISVTNESRACPPMALFWCLCWMFTSFVAPATRGNHTREEEQQTALLSRTWLVSLSFSVSLWGANKHSCLNKAVGTMPGPIGGARGALGGVDLHIQLLLYRIAIPIGKMLLAICLSSDPPPPTIQHISMQTPPRYTRALYNGSRHILNAYFHLPEGSTFVALFYEVCRVVVGCCCILILLFFCGALRQFWCIWN